MDSCSGLLLMIVPALALGLMGVPLPLDEALVFIRFIGAFVFGVGMLYLFTALIFVWFPNSVSLCLMLGVTAWLRLVVFVFTMLAILLGELSWAWWSVPFSDGLLALLQCAFIWKILQKRKKVGYV